MIRTLKREDANMGTRGGRGLRGILAGSLLFGSVTVGSVGVDSVPASAATTVALYVTTAGSGTACSQASPCGSIQTAITTATGSPYNGDDVTINVAEGTYLENDTIAASSLGSLTIAGTGASTTTAQAHPDDFGPGVFTINSGTVTISGLTVTGGDYYAGGGIFNDGATVSLADITVAHNGATGGGGGIDNAAGTMTLTGSTVSGNSTSDTAGGILNGGTMAISDSTVSGNYTCHEGGGIENSGAMTVTDSTVSGNTDACTGSAQGELSNDSGGTLNVAATIVASGSLADGDCSGGVTDEGYNIADDSTCGFGATGSIDNAPTLDSSLGALGNNGGLTQTILPAADSPAVGFIPTGTTRNSILICPRIDQRGVASQGSCTIGAVEVPFAIYINSIPSATPGNPYGPVTLHAANLGISTSPYVTTLKWKKLSLPKGLKLSPAGVLSGTSNQKLTAGQSSVTVQATETVITLNGKKKVKTKTTVQATIPLTIA